MSFGSNRMKCLGLDITSRCNFDCPYCMNGNRDKNMDLDLLSIGSILNEVIEQDTKFVSISGGEPILHNNFYEIIERISERKLHFNLFTNGYYYQDYDLMENNLLTEIIVSIDGSTQDVYSQTRNSEGFSRAWESIGFWTKLGMKVKVQILVNKFNLFQIVDIVKKSINCGATKVSLLGVLGYEDMRVSAEQVYKMWREVNKFEEVSFCTSLGICQGTHFCRALRDFSSSVVTPDGNFYYCCDIIDNGLLGNIKTNKLIDMMNKGQKIYDSIIKYREENREYKNEEWFNNCSFCSMIWTKYHFSDEENVDVRKII